MAELSVVLRCQIADAIRSCKCEGNIIFKARGCLWVSERIPSANLFPAIDRDTMRAVRALSKALYISKRIQVVAVILPELDGTGCRKRQQADGPERGHGVLVRPLARFSRHWQERRTAAEWPS